MTSVTDGILRRVTLHRLTQREVAKRVRRWRRKRLLLTPALWVVAGVGAVLAWFGRSK